MEAVIKSMLLLLQGMLSRQKKTLILVKIFFMDYNRSLYCGKCKVETDFYDQSFRKTKKCNLCGNVGLNVKKCNKCETFF